METEVYHRDQQRVNADPYHRDFLSNVCARIINSYARNSRILDFFNRKIYPRPGNDIISQLVKARARCFKMVTHALACHWQTKFSLLADTDGRCYEISFPKLEFLPLRLDWLPRNTVILCYSRPRVEL